MYSEIHQLKAIGLKKAPVAKRLEIEVETIAGVVTLVNAEFIGRPKLISG